MSATRQVLKPAQIGLAMRRLMASPDFKILEQLWLYERMRITEAGKKAPTEGAWHELRGFDRALAAPERWLRKLEKAEEQDPVAAALREAGVSEGDNPGEKTT